MNARKKISSKIYLKLLPGIEGYRFKTDSFHKYLAKRDKYGPESWHILVKFKNSRNKR